MALAVCCATISAEAQEEAAPPPQPGYAVEAVPGEPRPTESAAPAEGAPAEGAPAEAAPAEAPATEPALAAPETRDPFWPVGYIPPAERKAEAPKETKGAGPAVVKLEPPQWDLALKTLAIKGVMRSGSGYMAVINGQVTSENDTISAVFKGRTYSWRIAKIGKEGVRFERLELAQ